MGKLFGVAADEPGPLADMVGADIRSTHHAWPAGVAERFQLVEQPVGAASSEHRAVLKSEPARPAFSDQADGLEVETGPFALDALALRVGAGDILAGRRSDDDLGQASEVGNKSSCREVADIGVESDMRKILRIEDAAPFHDLTGGEGDEARPMQAERPAARGAAEEIERTQRQGKGRPRHGHAPTLRRFSQAACWALV
ncbi:hypothetical protein IT40_01050 [Paracoccus versutus]|nr:hypothetical protein IT40_01050 [Paracoccus versutus]